MRIILMFLVGFFTLHSLATSESIAKETQRKISKKQAKAAAEKLQNIEPRKLISGDSTKALTKWLEMEKEYKKIKAEVDKQTVRLEFFKERLDKAKKVAELYKAPGKDPDYLRDQKEAQDNEAQASKNFDIESKKLEGLKSELAVSEKRYNIAEKAYKIYNPSLSGFAGKGVKPKQTEAPKATSAPSKEVPKEAEGK